MTEEKKKKSRSIPTARIRRDVSITISDNKKPLREFGSPITKENNHSIIDKSKISDEQIEALGHKYVQKMTSFSDKILAQVKTSDLEDFGDGLNKLVLTAKKLDPSKFNKKGIISKVFGMFSSVKDKMLSEYSSVDSRMNQLVEEMDKNNRMFAARLGDLEQISQENKAAHEGLAKSKAEGQEMLLVLVSELDALEAKEQDHDAFSAQEVFVLKNKIDRLRKRIDDIDRSMLLSKQMHPQIEVLKNNNRILTVKFLDVKHTTIPAWKNAFGLYILQLEQQKAAQLVNNIHEATDLAFKMQANLMRDNVQLIAQANQKSVVSYETLEHVNKQLIGAFEDMEKINIQAKNERQALEPKIKQLEEELISKFSRKNELTSGSKENRRLNG